MLTLKPNLRWTATGLQTIATACVGLSAASAQTPSFHDTVVQTPIYANPLLITDIANLMQSVVAAEPGDFATDHSPHYVRLFDRIWSLSVVEPVDLGFRFGGTPMPCFVAKVVDVSADPTGHAAFDPRMCKRNGKWSVVLGTATTAQYWAHALAADTVTGGIKAGGPKLPGIPSTVATIADGGAPAKAAHAPPPAQRASSNGNGAQEKMAATPSKPASLPAPNYKDSGVWTVNNAGLGATYTVTITNAGTSNISCIVNLISEVWNHNIRNVTSAAGAGPLKLPLNDRKIVLVFPGQSNEAEWGSLAGAARYTVTCRSI